MKPVTSQNQRVKGYFHSVKGYYEFFTAVGHKYLQTESRVASQRAAKTVAEKLAAPAAKPTKPTKTVKSDAAKPTKPTKTARQR